MRRMSSLQRTDLISSLSGLSETDVVVVPPARGGVVARENPAASDVKDDTAWLVCGDTSPFTTCVTLSICAGVGWFAGGNAPKPCCSSTRSK